MSRFPVSQEKEEALLERMRKLGIREDDIEEQFVRSQGPGGQNVNKSSTCVMLFHRLSGLKIRCEEARSQGLNRFMARRRLVEKIAKQIEGVRTAEDEKIYKLRKQKKRRSRRTKEKLAKIKTERREKKDLRKSIRHEGI